MSGEGKFFFCKNPESGLVVDLENGEIGQGKKLVMAKPDPSRKSQWFFEDKIHQTVRNRLDTKYVLEVVGDNVVMNEYKNGEPNQKFRAQGDRIHNPSNTNFGLIAGSEGAPLKAGEIGSAPEHKFELEYQVPVQFYLVSKDFGNNQALDCEGGGRSPGTAIICWEKAPNANNQKWYEDKHGVLHSANCGLVIDTSAKNIAKLGDPNLDVQERCYVMNYATMEVCQRDRTKFKLHVKEEVTGKMLGMFQKDKQKKLYVECDPNGGNGENYKWRQLYFGN